MVRRHWFTNGLPSLLAACLVGCQSHGTSSAIVAHSESPAAVTKPAAAPAQQPTEDDLAVWAAALVDFTQSSESTGRWPHNPSSSVTVELLIWMFGRPAPPAIVVINRTASASADLDPQLVADGGRALIVSSSLRQSMVERNRSKASLDALDCKRADIVVMQPPEREVPADAEGGSYRTNWQSAYLERVRQFKPSAKICVVGWLPGYDAQGRHAVLRFRYFPVSPQRIATYLLTKKDGAWAVESRAFSDRQ